eukprot:TRINITY_DN149_c0_g2_i1.p1 TRINITY_DN149_c0_g2~~TRINITY_DN149_c0_g2_i1.p1  ORF type:complete len:102 (+),score=1.53 TRINITY_DN149_c0_g2_i1:148-453(+)
MTAKGPESSSATRKLAHTSPLHQLCKLGTQAGRLLCACTAPAGLSAFSLPALLRGMPRSVFQRISPRLDRGPEFNTSRSRANTSHCDESSRRSPPSPSSFY